MSSLPEYRNLTPDELEMADHMAEIGDCAALRRFQDLSASREGKTGREANPEQYDNPMQPRRL